MMMETKGYHKVLLFFVGAKYLGDGSLYWELLSTFPLFTRMIIFVSRKMILVAVIIRVTYQLFEMTMMHATVRHVWFGYSEVVNVVK